MFFRVFSASLLLLVSGCSFPQRVPPPVPTDQLVEQPLAQREEPTEESEKPIDTGKVFEEITQPLPSTTPPTPPIPRSVAALQQETFSGSDLTCDRVEFTNDAYTRHWISYTSNGLRISGIMNIPQGEGPFPVVILNHGYIDPAVYTVGRGLKREQDYLARRGYAVLHTDYRNHGDSDEDPLLQGNYLFRSYFYSIDSINAILALQQLNDPRLDTSRVGMMGHSMGGGVTMHALIARPDLIDAAILYAPVHSNEYFNMHRWRYGDLTDEERALWSGRIGDIEQIDTFAPYSAARNLDQIVAPVQIYHGTLDDSVPYQWSVDTIGAMQEAGLDAELITYTGEVHEFVTSWQDFMEGVVEFLDVEVSK